MKSVQGIPFPMGATVVGVCNLVASLFLSVLGVAVAVFYLLLSKEICDQNTSFAFCIQHLLNILGYVGIGIAVYGVIFFIFSVMLLVGVRMDRPNLMVPFIVWEFFSLLAVVGVVIYLGIVMAILYKIIVICSAIVALVIPTYFLGVVIKHSVELRKETPKNQTTPVVPFQQAPQFGFMAFGAPPQYPQKPDQQPFVVTPQVQQQQQSTSPLFSNRGSTHNSAPTEIADVDY